MAMLLRRQKLDFGGKSCQQQLTLGSRQTGRRYGNGFTPGRARAYDNTL
jgi:hypothetical protein